MSCTSLYTDDELVDKIKEINVSLDEAISKTDLDTGQSKHEVSQSLRTLREQREYYINLLYNQNPSLAACIAGEQVIQYRGRRC